MIRIKGARTHNLKDISVDIPRDSLVVITGLSGSGKSSLAFDTLYAEGQRRYVESLSAYARHFLSLMEKPDVDSIEGLSPAISIEQKTTSHNPRSTVGTTTEIYDYLRLLFARVGEPRCPEHNVPLKAQTVKQMVDNTLKLPEETKAMILAPIVRERKGEHSQVFDQLQAGGFVRVRVDSKMYDLDDLPKLNKKVKHTIEAVVDRFKVRKDTSSRIADSLETALKLADGLAIVAPMKDGDFEPMLFSSRFACAYCGHSVSELEPRLFSFNNPAGACSECDGLGKKQYFDPDLIIEPELSLAEGAARGWDPRNQFYFQMVESLADHYGFDVHKPFAKLSKKHQDILLNGSNEEIEFAYSNDRGGRYVRRSTFEGILPNFERRYRETESNSVRDDLMKYIRHKPCNVCDGTRLNETARNVFISNESLPALTRLSVKKASKWFEELSLKGASGKIAVPIMKEIRERLHFLVNVGLDYLTLDRSADTLSGGESQRIRLASQIGAGLVGVMYVLDEPSIGLHQRDNERLLETLTRLRDLGNTVIVVEHDEDAIRAADFIIDIGPMAGEHGGEVVAAGSEQDIINEPRSITGKYLSGEEKIRTPDVIRNPDPEALIEIKGAKGNNLKDVSVDIPVGLLTCVTGVSGSGKSTLINGTLYPEAAKELNKARLLQSADHETILGLEHFDKCVDIDQSPIGRTPRSNPATYTGIFTPVRELFAGTAEARARGYKPGRFSFNVKGGRCEACQGDGTIKVEMHFLADVYVTCDECHGKRYNPETLSVQYKGKNIYDVLDMTIEQALEFFEAIPSIAKKLQTLIDVGLGYIRLGQSAITLSGGEAQRVKLSKELSKRDTGRTLYILDEPTTGLHFHDIQQLLKVVHTLRDRGNTLIIIEHNLDVIKTSDWIVDLGPEGGDGGGTIIATGTPQMISEVPESHTGRFLKQIFEKEFKG